MEIQARGAWRMIEGSQPVQMKVLGLIEKHGREIVERDMESRKKERMARNDKLQEYWMRKRMGV